MTVHEFCDHCPGCRPALIDLTTGNVMAQDSPIMVKVNQVWNTQTTYAERKAFIEMTLHNSREPETLRLMQAVMAKIEQTMKSK